jgi:hypothetical protein
MNKKYKFDEGIQRSYSYNDETGNLVIKGGISEEIEKVILKNRVRRLVISSGMFLDLSLLVEKKDEIESLSISSSAVDWSALNELKNVREIYFKGPVDVKMDFRSLPNLAKLYIYHEKNNFEQIYELNKLEKLRINNWRESDFSKFTGLTGLKELELVDARKLESVRGINQISQIKSLSLTACSRFADISALKDAICLEALSIESCNKINWPNLISGLDNLRWLGLLKVKSFPSLKLFENCRELEEIKVIETKIEDGFVSMLKCFLNLKSASIQHKSSYDWKKVELKQYELELNNRYPGFKFELSPSLSD